jgi:type III restriction enzyme
MSTEPQDVDLVKPAGRFEMTRARLNDAETALPTYAHHLLCDEQGCYPAEMNAWEVKVLETEMKRQGFRFWYRNPQQPGQSSLGVAYLSGEQYGIVRPDFIFIAQAEDGAWVADLVDPHSLHLADALPKLRGLAQYAATHTGAFRRMESVAEAFGRLRVLDLTKAAVRDAIAQAEDAASLFKGPLAYDY